MSVVEIHCNYCKTKLSGVTEWFSYCLFLWSRDLEKARQPIPTALAWELNASFCAWLLCPRWITPVWTVSELVGLVNKNSEIFPWRLREGGSVSWFLLWFASGIFLLLHGLTKFHFSPDSISLKNVTEFPHCTSLPGYFGSSFSSLFLHLHQVDTKTRLLLFLALSLSILQIHTYTYIFIYSLTYDFQLC